MEHSTPPGERADCSTPSEQRTLVRCCCGNLLARWVEGALELKCRRCKRFVLVQPPERAGLGLQTRSPADVIDDR